MNSSKALPLAGPVAGPDGGVVGPAVGPAGEHAEQELEPAGGLEERVALHVEEEVAGRGRRQEAEAALVLRLEQAAGELVGAAAVELEAGLVAQRVEHRRRDAGHVEGRRRLRQADEGLDADAVQLLDVVAPDRGDERQVVVVLPALAADGDVVAPRAVPAGPRVDVGRRGEVRAEPALRGAQEGREVARAVGLDDHRAGHDVEPLRHAALDPRDLLRVEGQLEHGGRLGATARAWCPRPRSSRRRGPATAPRRGSRKSARPRQPSRAKVAW